MIFSNWSDVVFKHQIWFPFENKKYVGVKLAHSIKIHRVAGCDTRGEPWETRLKSSRTRSENILLGKTRGNKRASSRMCMWNEIKILFVCWVGCVWPIHGTFGVQWHLARRAAIICARTNSSQGAHNTVAKARLP